MMTDVYPRENFFFTNMLPASVAASAPPDRRYGCKRGRQRATGPAGSVLVKETVPRGDIISQKAQYRRSTDWAFSARLATTGSCSRCRRCTLEPPSSATYRRHLLCRRAGGEGLAALRDGEVVSEVGCGVRSNRPKQEVFGGAIRPTSQACRWSCAVRQVRCPTRLGATRAEGSSSPSCSVRWY